MVVGLRSNSLKVDVYKTSWSIKSSYLHYLSEKCACAKCAHFKCTLKAMGIMRNHCLEQSLKQS